MFVICCHRFLELKLLAKYTIFSASWILRHLPLGTVEHVERRRNNYCSAIFDQETHHTCSYQTNNWLNFSVYGFAWESGNPVQRLRSMRQIQHNILRLYWGRPQLYFFLSIIQFGSTYHGQRKFFFLKNWHFGWNRQEWLISVWLVREVLYQNWDHFEMVVAQSFRHLTADFPFIYTHAEYD